MEESELVQREGDVRDEKESDPSAFLSFLKKQKTAFSPIENQLLTSKMDFS